MRLEMLIHQSGGAYAYPVDPHRLRVVLKAARGDLVRAQVLYSDRYAPPGEEELLPMEVVASDRFYDYFQATLELPLPRFRYVFYVQDRTDGFWLGERGPAKELTQTVPFQYPYIAAADLFSPPSWLKDSIFYQIFPDRFYDGDISNNPKGTRPWGEAPTPAAFFGGDLEGIRQKIDYLTDLGVNAIYLTPIFTSPSNHKYDTTDYYHVDPAFGRLEDLQALAAELHSRGMRLILDGVFNHAGAGFFAFQEALRAGKDSPYWDWFNFHNDAGSADGRPSYETFANGVWNMPKLRTDHPAVRQYLLQVAVYWIKEANIDGWRLDVANEVDHQFWRLFRQAVKGIKGEAFLLGEIWHEAQDWLHGDQFDSVMNYPWRDAVLDFFARRRIGPQSFDWELARQRMSYPWPVVTSLVNLLGSHDTPRFLTEAGGDADRLALAVLFQMTYPGVPMVYYGDEVGLEGGPDPDCRRTMIWDGERQNQKLLSLYRRLIGIRRQHPWLADGGFTTWIVDEARQLYGYLRSSPAGDRLWILFNNSPRRQRVDIPLEPSGSGRRRPIKALTDLLTEKNHLTRTGRFMAELAPQQGLILKPSQT